MMSLKTNAGRLATVLFSALGIACAGVGGAAHAQSEPPQGWFKTCTKQEDVDVCTVQNELRAGNGQLLTSVIMIEATGKINKRVLQIAVPTGRLIPPGVGLQIDTNETQKVDYVICAPDRCVAEAQLTDEMISAFKRGSELTLTTVNFRNQPNPMKMTLAGFTDAYEGEPLQQDDLDERQRKLEEYVSKNNEAFAEKLREAQENAKETQ